MKIQVTNDTWHTKKIAVRDKTMQTLKNGRVIPTAANMLRKAAKI